MSNMEMTMMTQKTEGTFLAALQHHGAATIEQLMSLLDFSWEQTFGIVDRLSRSGAVRLTRVGSIHYVETVGGT